LQSREKALKRLTPIRLTATSLQSNHIFVIILASDRDAMCDVIISSFSFTIMRCHTHSKLTWWTTETR